MTALENICPACKENNELEAVVCWNCGMALEDPFMDPGARTKTTDTLSHAIESSKEWPVDEATVPHGGIAIYLEGMANPSYIDTMGEFVLGRRVEKYTDMQETLFDLSLLGGFGLGVSRRHAVIRRKEHGYEVLDLGSVNGTWINDERLVPQRPYPLTSGSHLRLGNMRLYVIFRPENKKS